MGKNKDYQGPCHVMVLFQLGVNKTSSEKNDAMEWAGPLLNWVHCKGIPRSSLDTDDDYKEVS